MKTTMLRICFQKIKAVPGFIKIAVLAVVCAVFLNFFVFQISLVRGKSMEPLITENSVIIGFRPAPELFGVSAGDVVIFRKKSVIDENLVKKVFGVAGDRIEICNHIFYCNGKEVFRDESLADLPYCIVPEDSFFVMGVNPTQSNDSRHWTDRFVRKDEIKSKVIM